MIELFAAAKCRDAFLSEALYEADKEPEKFAAAPWECVCLQDGRRSRR